LASSAVLGPIRIALACAYVQYLEHQIVILVLDFTLTVRVLLECPRPQVCELRCLRLSSVDPRLHGEEAVQVVLVLIMVAKRQEDKVSDMDRKQEIDIGRILFEALT